MTFTSPSPTPLPLNGIFSTVSLSKPELSKVCAAQGEISRIWELSGEYEPTRENIRIERKPTRSQVALDEAAAAMRENPTAETTARFFEATLRSTAVQQHGGTVVSACRDAVDRVNHQLGDIVKAVGGRARAALEKAISVHRADTKKSVIVDVEAAAAEFEARVAETFAALDHELIEAEADPLSFLLGRDLLPD
jgi:hypothetical protein